MARKSRSKARPNRKKGWLRKLAGLPKPMRAPRGPRRKKKVSA